jgi:hypothetical protein
VATHLLGEPIVAVDVHLDRKGKPRLHANVHEAEFWLFRF